MESSDNLILSVCVRCRDGRETRESDLECRGGRRLARAIADAFPHSAAAQRGLTLRGVHCMSQCKRPCAIALSGLGRFTYLFGDLDPALHAGDVLSMAAAYVDAPAGFLPRAERPEVLRAGILGRIPPIGFKGDLVEPLSSHSRTPNKETSAP